MADKPKDYPIHIFAGKLGVTKPRIKHLQNIKDWLRITCGLGMIRAGKMTIRRHDLERASFDQRLRAWERRLIQAIATGDTDQFKGTEFVVIG